MTIEVRRQTPLRLPRAWPVYALFVLLPLWWALGISAFIWPLMAVPMLFGLLMGQRDVRWPRGFGLWMLFLGWMLLSGTRVADADRLTSFLYRGSLYAAATVLFLYVFNCRLRWCRPGRS